MTTRHRLARTPALWLPLFLLLAACGGGGGEGPDAALGVFEGDWWTSRFVGFLEGNPPSALGEWGWADADGAGSINLSLSVNSDGVLGSSGGPFPLSYEVDGTGRLLWIRPPPPPATGAFLTGWIGATGDLGVLGCLLENDRPAITMVVRRAGTFNASILIGAYHDLTLSRDTGGGGFAAAVLRTEYRASGSWTSSGRVNQSGAVTDMLTWGTYGVGLDGSLLMTAMDGAFWAGGILQGGDVAAAAGGGIMDSDPLLRVLVRTSTDASNATFQGRYGAVSLARTGAGCMGAVGTINANGDGAWTSTLVGNLGGHLVPEAEGAGSFAVSPLGVLDMRVGATTLRGGVSPSGDFAVVGGPVTPGGVPQLWLLTRL